MRKFTTNYVINYPGCARFKASNQKPAGLLQTPVQAQRFETIAIDLFGPLPESKNKKKWIFIVEDVATFCPVKCNCKRVCNCAYGRSFPQIWVT
ncbi:hypothetical protein AVEN_142037-1 [Araneus ventricosus]|uniref:Uncharacterized protein n=1 Tax=Araneus ventricosus TaxID=182803 RepID=A0A4Y2LT03_ARAVE|nr:hypothetical protein AVEN_142037-1 [Araneus ventricosus]